MRKLLFISALSLCPLTAADAATYKCLDDGHVTYQSMPCKGQGGAINVLPPEESGVPASKGTATDPSAIAARFDEQAKTLVLEQRLRDIDFETNKLQTEITQYQSEMQSELAPLQQQKDYWATQPNGKMWEQSVANDMNTVSEKYQTKIQSAQDRLNALSKEKTDINDKLPDSKR